MSEENKKDIEKLPQHVQEDLTKQIDNAFLHENIKDDIMNNPKYDPFFEKYNKSSREYFSNSYKWKKANWLQYGEMNLRNEQDLIFKYENIAEECLWQIQQKKLFNLQCEWRAEKVKIPEIRITWDFRIWQKDIKNCNFIEPISEEEIELYKEYIMCENFEKDLLDFMIDWQDYDEIKENYENEDEENLISEWYQFYDSRKGTGTLISLPDLRGEKEEYYRDIHFENEKKKREEEIEKQKREGTYKEQVYDKRPSMGAYGEYLDEFVNTFEDEKIKRYYRAFENTHRDYEDDEELEEAVNILLDAKEPVEMEAWHDWREAVIRTSKKYERRQIYYHIDDVFRNYLERKAMGISYEKPDRNTEESLSDMLIKQIYDGRKLNGEPEDLNF